MKPANSKTINRLLFACDHNSLNHQEFINEDNSITVKSKPTPAVAEMIEQFIRDGMRVALLIESNSKKTLVKEYVASLSDELEIIQLPLVDSKTLTLACKGFAVNPGEILLIAADRKLRATALKAGMMAAPHPAMAKSIIDNQTLLFGKLDGPKSVIRRLSDVVPYYIETNDNDTCQLFGSLSPNTIAQAITHDIDVQIYPVDIASHDLLFIRIDEHIKKNVLPALSDKTVLFHENGRILVALDADVQNDNISVNGDHGHYWYLMPSPELLQPGYHTNFSEAGFSINAQQTLLLRSLCKSELIERMEPHQHLIENLELLFPFCPMTASEYQNTVNRYSGVTALDSGGIIQSREIRHTDNERAVNALLSDLHAMGYCAWTHSFTVAGLTVKNVIADLPGRGYYKIIPEMVDKIHHVLDLHRKALPVTPWLAELEKILGKEWSAQLCANAKTPWQLRKLAELQLGIFEYRSIRHHLAGFGAQLVIVGCHLDSTAMSDEQYNPVTDAAPGADDNASGIAGTLATAQFMTRYRNKLTHSVRFCFFNAEEHGMVGSQIYAAYLKSINAKVKATVCMDMIGFNSDANRLFEVHAGFTDPLIRDQSVLIANQIASSAAQLGNLPPAQIYCGTIPSSGSDRNTYDAAIDRSDHASFHQQGYPAVVVSEDFFINQAGEPSSDANPNYHRGSDTVIDSSYGADIACAVAHAVKELAK